MASELAALLQQRRPSEQLQGVIDRYLEARRRVPGLGDRVRLRPDAEGRERLLAIAPIPIGAAVTAFAPDVVGAPLRVDASGDAPRAQKGVRLLRVKGALYALRGPLAARSDVTLEELAEYFTLCAFPLDPSFAPAQVAFCDPETVVAPDLAAIHVEGVVTGNPFEGLAQTDEALPAFAQTALAYLQKVEALANVEVHSAADLPTVLIATRNIGEGETIRTGRPPSFWVPAAHLEKVAAHILALAGDPQAPPNPFVHNPARLRGLLGLPPI